MNKYEAIRSKVEHSLSADITTKIHLIKYNENFTIKRNTENSDIFHITAQNIDCGFSLEPPRRGGSNEYQQSMFLSRNKKNNAHRCLRGQNYIGILQFSQIL